VLIATHSDWTSSDNTHALANRDQYSHSRSGESIPPIALDPALSATKSEGSASNNTFALADRNKYSHSRSGEPIPQIAVATRSY
jgi:hypothetical protein